MLFCGLDYFTLMKMPVSRRRRLYEIDKEIRKKENKNPGFGGRR
jgi:hypothetical protein